MRLKKSLILMFAVAAAISFSPSFQAKTVSTRLKPPKVTEKESVFEGIRTYPSRKTEFEEVAEKLTFMGYDKKSSAAKETFFIDNGSNFNVNEIELEISYFNAKGSLIHKRVVELKGHFPSKETRKVDIHSWDTQKSFHYINSVPSRNGSTPYTVKFKILSLVKQIN